MHKNLKFNILIEGQKNGVSTTCAKHNISRTIYYRWMSRYKANGIDGLDDIRKSYIPVNKTNNDVEASILSLIRTYPSYGPRAINYLLEEMNHHISESAVYNVMKRHHLTTKESRRKFAKKKITPLSKFIPALNHLSSGECWVFWITDYGQIDQIGSIYEYTFFDLVSQISCTRLYNTVDFNSFEDLLAGTAIPVAKSLKFNTKYLCFFQDIQFVKGNKSIFSKKIQNTLENSGLDVNTFILSESSLLDQSHQMRTQYTKGCLSYLMPLINEGASFTQLKTQFQRYLRHYNLGQQARYEDGLHTPIDYHIMQTGSKLILPLWAYIDRDY